MKDADAILSQLGHAARSEPAAGVDVRAQVLRTIAVQCPVPRLDVVPFFVGGVAVTTAATLLAACLPSWKTLFDPWAIYFTL